MMAPAPYCLTCNRHHVDACPPGERLWALLGWFLLLVAAVIVGLAFGAASVGVL
ncbi:hypothetical protein I5H06_gp52 [Mycobacterium phage SirPhilip]|uniref:Uncharacterized protein n=1 Tax=Mycobacterium phage SirPhilip TaxID=2015824 RepID=A0A222ZLT3_9CAUD|nr:hypothetical protein I5H06_gp52 [Mycobacterium phage SirPhilip]ASR85252.1 hypothetical protein SEA_SIRPHILIP_50 [Mycobacterium phage SirPhilip]